MSIHRTNYFIAKPGQGPSLARAFAPIIALILDADGCIDCQLLISNDNPDLVLVLEEWNSIEAHQGAAKIVRPDDFSKVMGFLAEKPSGNYFSRVI